MNKNELIEKIINGLKYLEDEDGIIEIGSNQLKLFLQDTLPSEQVVEIKGKGCGLGRCKCGEDTEEECNYCGNCGAKTCFIL